MYVICHITLLYLITMYLIYHQQHLSSLEAIQASRPTDKLSNLGIS